MKFVKNFQFAKLLICELVLTKTRDHIREKKDKKCLLQKMNRAIFKINQIKCLSFLKKIPKVTTIYFL
ncbi:hypothetical protein BpHYR1_039594 [Brachionus plicatilis]|uniref:Uncharacterized protein n=1 Tax=Brachionus plicatilis TaxID=10195 RepID=A0A3M7P2E6_BRAPC|nr:hypothetical protein BpHYR1_039594 [Brachionus plicatilis]